MRLVNYSKDGQPFEVEVTAYPVFDSISAVGADAELAVLTHFASVMNDVKLIGTSNEEQSRSSSSRSP